MVVMASCEISKELTGATNTEAEDGLLLLERRKGARTVAHSTGLALGPGTIRYQFAASFNPARHLFQIA
jgi:hypothetical protein